MSLDVPGREFEALIPPLQGVCRVPHALEEWGNRDPKCLPNLRAERKRGSNTEQIDVGTDRERHAPDRCRVGEASDALAVNLQIEPDFLQRFALGSGAEIAVGWVAMTAGQRH